MASVGGPQPQSTAPIPLSKLTEIANDACDSASQAAQTYDHYSTESWNAHIINTILQQLLSETSSDDQPPQYKFAVNSTIMQHSAEDTAEGSVSVPGKRGMHSASGAYWNSEKDGMWNFKYEKSESKGFDGRSLLEHFAFTSPNQAYLRSLAITDPWSPSVVISVIWISVV